jgi:hypothetical protein
MLMQNLTDSFRRAFTTGFLLCWSFVFCFEISGIELRSEDQGDAGQTVVEIRTPTAADIKRGERLFNGLVPLGPDAPSCASCHNTAAIDTFNWNPSAYEIAVIYSDRSVGELQSVVMDPVTAKMSEVHDNYELTDEDLFQVKAWMDVFSDRSPDKRPVITNLLLFILLFIVLIGALADLIVFRMVPYKLVHLVIILGSGLFMLKTIAHEAIALGRSQYYQPDQPIKFSHKVHAGDNRTDCLYCHSIAEYSHSAGIPSTSQCMNCHVIVREGTHSGRFEINKLVEAYENEIPVRWIRIHNLPDHAFFSHSQHVGAAGLDCSECHGEVEKMDRLMQVEDLSMGWCLDCHRSTEVNVLENEFYSVYMQLRDDVRNGRIDFATARETGGTDCMKCHY